MSHIVSHTKEEDIVIEELRQHMRYVKPLQDEPGFFICSNILRLYANAYHLDVSRAESHLKDTVEWRRKHRPLRVVCRYCHRTPGFHSLRQVAFDVIGRPVLYMCFGQSTGYHHTFDDHLEHCIHIFENAIKTMVTGISTWVLIVDFTGASKKDFTPIVAERLHLTLAHHYPGRLDLAICINQGYIFRNIWKMAKTFVSSDTAKKIKIIKSKRQLKAIFDQLFVDEVIDWLLEEIATNEEIENDKCLSGFGTNRVNYWEAPMHLNDHDSRGTPYYISNYVYQCYSERDKKSIAVHHHPHPNIAEIDRMGLLLPLWDPLPNVEVCHSQNSDLVFHDPTTSASEKSLDCTRDRKQRYEQFLNKPDELDSIAGSFGIQLKLSNYKQNSDESLVMYAHQQERQNGTANKARRKSLLSRIIDSFSQRNPSSTGIDEGMASVNINSRDNESGMTSSDLTPPDDSQMVSTHTKIHKHPNSISTKRKVWSSNNHQKQALGKHIDQTESKSKTTEPYVATPRRKSFIESIRDSFNNLTQRSSNASDIDISEASSIPAPSSSGTSIENERIGPGHIIRETLPRKNTQLKGNVTEMSPVSVKYRYKHVRREHLHQDLPQKQSHSSKKRPPDSTLMHKDKKQSRKSNQTTPQTKSYIESEQRRPSYNKTGRRGKTLVESKERSCISNAQVPHRESFTEHDEQRISCNKTASHKKSSKKHQERPVSSNNTHRKSFVTEKTRQDHSHRTYPSAKSFADYKSSCSSEGNDMTLNSTCNSNRYPKRCSKQREVIAHNGIGCSSLTKEVNLIKQSHFLSIDRGNLKTRDQRKQGEPSNKNKPPKSILKYHLKYD